MGRHEIRLRRKKMTSRRIESHKDYYDLLRRHERTSIGKKIIKVIIYIIILLGVMMLGYFALQKTGKSAKEESNPGQAAMNLTITSRPGVSLHVLLNTKQNGKT